MTRTDGREGPVETGVLQNAEPRTARFAATIVGLMVIGFALLAVAAALLLTGGAMAAAAFSGACLLLWLAAAVLQYTGQAQDP